MNFTPELMLSISVTVAMGGGIYAAIRADLARLHERSEAAHERLNWLQDRVTR